MPHAVSPPPAPLPLTPLESYLLADDRADYPMTFWTQAFLSGAVDKPVMMQAFYDAVELHPLLGALTVREGGRLAWSFNERRRPPLHWERAGVPVRCEAGERIDLSREPGVRAWVRESPEGIESTLQFHHCCCDGMGAMQFLSDNLLLYAHRRGDPVAPPRAPDYERLARRGDLSAVRPYARQRLRLAVRGVGRIVRHFVWQRPAPLYTPQAAGGGLRTTALPGIVWHTFDAAGHRRLRHEARRRHVSMNALLLGCLFRAMCAWNAPHDPRLERRWLRILMPAEMRSLAEADLSACNAVSYFFVNRQPGACADAERLLQGIHEETTADQRRQVAASFFASTRLMTRLGAIGPFLHSGPCLATAVLTYLGDLTSRLPGPVIRGDGRLEAGGLVLQRAIGTPPLRKGTRAAFGVYAYAGELTVSLRTDPHCFAPEDSARLLALYVKQLEGFA